MQLADLQLDNKCSVDSLPEQIEWRFDSER
jgi:hypothetical protein